MSTFWIITTSVVIVAFIAYFLGTCDSKPYGNAEDRNYSDIFEPSEYDWYPPYIDDEERQIRHNLKKEIWENQQNSKQHGSKRTKSR